MKLASARTLEQMRSVLKEQSVLGPDPVYQVYTIEEVDNLEPQWANQTIIAHGRLGEEYPKTFGHYHSENSPNEVYHLVEGEGVLLLQKKDLSEVYLIKAKPGDEVVITPGFGHSWSNTGQTELVSWDDWRTGHTPDDYAEIQKLKGMAFYLIDENGQPKAMPNPNYQNLPEPIWCTALEFNQRFSSSSLTNF